MAKCGELILRRPFSLHRKERGKLALLFNRVGQGTHWLAKRQKGDSLDLLGPLGNGFSVPPKSRHLLLVAGGIGLAPLFFLAQRELNLGRQVTLLLGARSASLLYPEALLPPGIESVVATEDGSAGRKGLVTDLLPQFSSGADQIFACGPLPMYRTMSKMNLGKPVQVVLEQMLGCGVGACRGCSVETQTGLKRVCREGPVFNLEEILWEKVKEPRPSQVASK